MKKIIVVLVLFLTACGISEKNIFEDFTKVSNQVATENFTLKPMFAGKNDLYDLSKNGSNKKITNLMNNDENFEYYLDLSVTEPFYEVFDNVFTINGDERDIPTLAIWQNDINEFVYQYILFYDYDFTLDGKQGLLTIRYSFGTGEYFTENMKEDYFLNYNNEEYDLSFDFDNKAYIYSLNDDSVGDEELVSFVEDLYIDFMENSISKENGTDLVDKIIQHLTDNEIKGLNKEFESDKLYDFSSYSEVRTVYNYLTYPLINTVVDNGLILFEDKNGIGLADKDLNIIIKPNLYNDYALYDNKYLQVYYNYDYDESLIDEHEYYLNLNGYAIAENTPSFNKALLKNKETYYYLKNISSNVYCKFDFEKADDEYFIFMTSDEDIDESKSCTVIDFNMYRVNTDMGIVDKNQKVIIQGNYYSIDKYQYKTFLAFKDDNEGIFINEKGKEIFSSKYIYNFDILINNYIAVKVDIDGDMGDGENIKYGVIDNQGNEVLPFEYDEVVNTEKAVYFKKDNTWYVHEFNN